MAGIYIHIPFCRQACHYCDFHFSTSRKHQGPFLEALLKEIELRKDYLGKQSIESVYFGGGTPSILPAQDIQRIYEALDLHFKIDSQVEVTLEANPDDLNTQHVQALRNTPINRFSIGIQSFYDADLQWMNRAHNRSQAEASIKRVQDAGYKQITCDLIYGYPLLSTQKLESNIAQLVAFEIPHISAYAMTVEPRTPLATFIRKGAQVPMNEQQSAEQFMQLTAHLAAKGYEQYEISNFARNAQYSRHNTNYWLGVHYLGLGPSAHSFNGLSRSWNVAQNHTYMNAIIKTGQVPSESEILTEKDRFNEYVMTALRTRWGISLQGFNNLDAADIRQTEHILNDFVDTEEILKRDDYYYLTPKGKLFADRIASSLFLID